MPQGPRQEKFQIKKKEEKRKRVSNAVDARRNTRGDARAAMSVTLLRVEKGKKRRGNPGPQCGGSSRHVTSSGQRPGA